MENHTSRDLYGSVVARHHGSGISVQCWCCMSACCLLLWHKRFHHHTLGSLTLLSLFPPGLLQWLPEAGHQGCWGNRWSKCYAHLWADCCWYCLWPWQKNVFILVLALEAKLLMSLLSGKFWSNYGHPRWVWYTCPSKWNNCLNLGEIIENKNCISIVCLDAYS